MPLSKTKLPMRAVPYHLDTVVKPPHVSTDTVVVTMGGKEYHTTRDLLATGKTPNFFTALAKGNFSELHARPAPLSALQAMEPTPPPGEIYRVSLPETDRKSYRYIKHWQRTCTERRPGMLPRSIPQTELDVLALDARVLCMGELETEITRYYGLREKAHLEPNTKNIYMMARATGHELDDDELVDTLDHSIEFMRDFETFAKLIEAPGLARQDPRFLICALPSIVDSGLYQRIVEHVTALGCLPELLHAVRTDVPFLTRKIKQLDKYSDTEHQRFFIDQFLSIDDGVTLEALLDVEQAVRYASADRELQLAQKLSALRGSDEDWTRFAKKANDAHKPFECVQALQHLAPENSLRAGLLAKLRGRELERFDGGYFCGLGVVCLGLRPTFEEIAGESHTDMAILDRILGDWNAAGVDHPSAENNAAWGAFRQACETHRLTLLSMAAQTDANP